MLNKIAARVAALAAGVVVLATAGPAEAARPTVTDTVHIKGNYDNGAHGPWARLSYDRSVRISRATAANTWNVTLTDRGTFSTIPGKQSPGAGVAITRTQAGRIEGVFKYTVLSTGDPSGRRVRSGYNFRCNVNGTGDRAQDCPGMPAATNAWPGLYFGSGATVTPGSWRWVFTTCKERWTNGSAGDTGDITGRPCVETVTPGAPVVQQPTCAVRHGSVTVPNVAGVRWTLKSGWRSWSMQSGHAYTVAAGKYRIEADARSGYRLARHVRDSWAFTIVKAPASWQCPTPSPTPSPTPTPTVTVTS
jgi:hypothetical protein